MERARANQRTQALALKRKANVQKRMCDELKVARARRQHLPLLFSNIEEDSKEWKKMEERVMSILGMIGTGWTEDKKTAFRQALRDLPFRLEFATDDLRDGFYFYGGEELSTMAGYAVNLKDVVALQILLEEGADTHDYSPWAEARKEDVEIWRLWKLFDTSQLYRDGSTRESRLVKLLRRDDSRNGLESLEDALVITKSLAE